MLHQYDPTFDSITVPVVLSNSASQPKIFAKLDTGARYCIFQREHGEVLDIDIESGSPMKLDTLAGSFLTYGHEVTIAAIGYEFDATVYFTALFNSPRNVLGRRGWIEKFRLGIVDYDGRLYVSRYDDP